MSEGLFALLTFYFFIFGIMLMSFGMIFGLTTIGLWFLEKSSSSLRRPLFLAIAYTVAGLILTLWAGVGLFHS